MYFYCEKCKKKYPINSHSYQCECGGMFKLHRDPGEEYVDEISLGEVVTPLVEFKSGKLDFLLKLEGTQPTGSFKDRGACGHREDCPGLCGQRRGCHCRLCGSSGHGVRGLCAG